MVYQEQIMQAAQALAGYSLGQADLLRRIMGKKKPEDMAAERPKFVAGCTQNGIGEDKAGEIFDIMAKFAEYGFNKSHSAAYSLLAYRTAYLKAHYPAEYMMAVLSHWTDSIDRMSQFMDESRRMGLPVLPPDVNTSALRFSVTQLAETPAKGKAAAVAPKAAIRFGLGAIKGLGEATAQAILDARTSEGPFKSLFDFSARVPSKFYSKKALECLAYAGAFDSFGLDRWTYLPRELEDNLILDQAVLWGQREQAARQSNQSSLFGGDVDAGGSLGEPTIVPRAPGPLIQKLKLEKDVLGLYLSAHPLDKYRAELSAFATCPVGELAQRRGEVRVGGIVASVRDRVSQKGNRYGTYQIEDHQGNYEFSLFGDAYAMWKGFLELGNCVFIEGRIEARYYQSDEFELKVQRLKLLDTVLEDMTKSIRIEINASTLHEGLVRELYTCLSNYPGKAGVRFDIDDGLKLKHIALRSRNVLVKPSERLLRDIERLGLNYALL